MQKILPEDIGIRDILRGGGTVVTLVTVEVVETEVTWAIIFFLRGGTDFPSTQIGLSIVMW